MELTQRQISEMICKMTQTKESFSLLMSEILSSLMKQERSLWQLEHRESSNGYRPRHWSYGGMEFHLHVPRSRAGNFYPTLLGIIQSEEEEKDRLFTSLYSKGLTTDQIGEISEEIYGRHYSKQQVSSLAQGCREDIERWLDRPLNRHYRVVYIDATFVSTRRDQSVRKEAYYTMLGVLPDGSREVLALINHPTEGAQAWRQELQRLQERGAETIDLIVSDGLTHIEDAVAEAFPNAGHQLCVTHLKRSMGACVAARDKAQLMNELKEVFPLGKEGYTMMGQFEKFRTFVAKWAGKYRSFSRFDTPRNIAYFTYLSYPAEYHRMIYTTNWIERLNRSYKRTLKFRAAMPSAASALFLMGTVAFDMSQGTYSRKLPIFQQWELLKEQWENKQ